MKDNLFFLAALISLSALGLTLTACGPSKATLAIIEKTTIDEVDGLNNKLTWLRANAQSGGNYTIELNQDEIRKTTVNSSDAISQIFSEGISAKRFFVLYYKDKSNVTITIRGVGANRTISCDSNNDEDGTIFSIESGVTLILDNITIKGCNATKVLAFAHGRYPGAIWVNAGGTLIMNDGSVITNHFNKSGNGGGVKVSSGGTFIMKGGTISGNICSPIITSAEREITACKGGGVYVEGGSELQLFSKDKTSATFIKTGGTIFGYNANDIENSNIIRDPATGGITQNNGHAIYFGNKIVAGIEHGIGKSFDTTIGPEITLEFKDGVLKEGRVEAVSVPVIKETASEQPVAPAAPAEVLAPATPQAAAQEYQAALQKIQAKQKEALLEYQTTVQKNPAAQQEALQKYQKTIQETQLEAQESVKKYQEAMQRK